MNRYSQLLPEALYRVHIQTHIATHKGNILHQRLGYQQTIEGITVMEWHADDCGGMPWLDVKHYKAVDGNLLLDEWQEGLIQGVLSHADFNGDFPVSYWTNVNLIGRISDGSASLGAERRIIEDEPQKSLGVQ